MFKTHHVVGLYLGIVLSMVLMEVVMWQFGFVFASWSRGSIVALSTCVQALLWLGVLRAHQSFSWWVRLMQRGESVSIWILWAALIGIAWFARGGILFAFEQIPFFQRGLDTLTALFSFSTTLEYVFVGIVAIGIAPVVEEIIFRGFVYSHLRSIAPAWFAIFGSALIFGVVHTIPLYALNAFLVGLPLAWLYERSGSLWSPIVMHVVNNAIVFLGLIFLPTL